MNRKHTIQNLLRKHDFTTRLSLGALLSALVFSSCMHGGMMPMAGGHSSTSQHTPGAPIMQKGVIQGSIRATADFPSLRPHHAAAFTLRLTDPSGRHPVSGATVFFHARYANPVSGSPGDHHADMRHLKEIDWNQQLEDRNQPGIYTVTFEPTQPGEHVFMFHVTNAGGKSLEPEMILETQQIVREEHEPGTGAGTYILVGGVVMGAMMLLMMAANGRLY